jgi:isoleucyl-tRNA synthetase
MQLAREISSLGRSARMNAKLKVRQPLAKVEVMLADNRHRDWLAAHADLIRTELNVKEVEFTSDAEHYITYQVQPNFKRLGPRVGKLMPDVKKSLANIEGGPLLAELKSQGKIQLDVKGETVTLDEDDIQISLQAKDGWAAAEGAGCVVVLSTELTDQLVREGFAKDLVRVIQEQRKQQHCDYTDRIQVTLGVDSSQLQQAINENRAFIMSETLSNDLLVNSAAVSSASENGGCYEVGEFEIHVSIEVVEPS